MPSKQWKNLDEFYAGDAARSDEFDPEVGAALRALRAEYGLSDEDGGHAPIQVDGPNASEPSREDLRQLLPALGRRGFLKLTGAAAVFGLAGCWHEPPETLVPYAEQPEGSTIGKARFYSTALRVDGIALPVMAKLYDGRPIKLEGNPDDPYSGGSLSLRGQAALLDLYDPDRFRDGPRAASGRTTWAELDAAVGESLKQGGVGLLAPALDGPANAELIARLRAGFGDRLRVASYRAYTGTEARAARAAAFGDAQAVDPTYHFDQADVVVTLGSCPISGGTTDHYDHVAIGKQRKLKVAGAAAEKAQLIAFEPTLSQTGSVADLRQRAAMGDMALIGWGLAYRVAELLGRAGPMPGDVQKYEYQDAVSKVGLHPALARDGVEAKNAIDYAAQALVDAKGKGIVYVGGAVHDHEDSRQLHLAACYLNWLLGNEGRTITTERKSGALVADHTATAELLAAAAGGEVKTLILWDANVVYGIPGAKKQIEDAKATGCLVVALSDRLDDTAALADWVAPTTHGLEGWGDGEPRPGHLVLQQAVVGRLWDNRQAQQSLLAFAAAASLDGFAVEATDGKPQLAVVSRAELWEPALNGVLSWQGLVAQVWKGSVRAASKSAAGAASFWKAALSRGFVAVGAEGPGAPAAFKFTAMSTKPGSAVGAGMSLVLNASRTLGDGNQANNAWLQETPDPISKVTWDNYLAVSITDARKEGFERDSVATLTVGEHSVTVPVQVQPGQLAGTVELFLGWGQAEGVGSVARDGGLGQAINAAHLSDGKRWGIPCTVAKADGSYKLASTQFHHHMDGRDIVLSDPIEVHRKDPDGNIRASHHHHLWHGGSGAINAGVGGSGDDAEPNISMWGQTHVFPGRRWGMNIDLNACDGCGACIVACSAENNVPVVGRDQVRRGREMHWMRIDRYYSTPLAGPELKERPDLAALDKDDDRNESKIIEEIDPEHLAVHHQPMMCQHCGHAPCEEVCPAMATMRNEEAVNLMVYNRCIGTRFCANNCPYKVRRFNYYEYAKLRKGPIGDDPLGRVARNVVVEGSTTSQDELGSWDAPLALMLNPAVTVRSKGVMEKCNFCVQRTRDIRDVEKRSNKAYDDTDVTLTTACAQTCPTGAIVFGDVNDPFAQVTQHRDANPHHYTVLDKVLNTRPAVSYLREVRNIPATQAELDALTGHGGGGDSHDGHDHDGHDHDGHDHGDHARVVRKLLTEGQA